MSYQKRGLRKILNPGIDCQRLVITHMDQLLRFGADLVFAI